MSRLLYIPSVNIFTSIKYGLLYNWYAATDARNICSNGWHIQTKAEFDILIAYLGGATVAGGKLKETGTTHWNSPNTSATNEVGFNGRGSGYTTSGGISNYIKESANYWLSDGFGETAKTFGLRYNSAAIFGVSNQYKTQGQSLRPMKDSTTLTHGQTGNYVDPSGIIYPTICIGTQELVACNIITKHYRNGDPITEVTDNTAWAALTTGAMCVYNNDESNM